MSTIDAPLALPHSPGPAYAELHCHSNFSLLDGASSPEALVAQAQALGLRALALTDHDSLAGAVRFQGAARKAGLPWIFGAEVTLEGPLEGASGAPPERATLPHLTLLAETQEGYANLCRLISAARLDQLPAPPAAFDADDPFDPAAPVLNWPGKLPPRLRWERLAQHTAGLIVLTGCHQGPVAAPLLADRTDGGMRAAARAAGHLHDLFGPGQIYVELQHQSRPDDDLLVRRLAQLARTLNLPLVATNNVHYATREGARLRDAFLAIDENIPLSEARKRGLLPVGSLACLTDAATMQRRFRTLPQAIANTVEIAARCSAAIDFSHHRLPAFLPANSPVSEFQMLYQLCHDALPTRYPDLRSAVLKQLAHELDVIERAGLAGYFLIVWDMVRFARSRGVRCQGRGSAANSIVAYLLGITSVDPLRHNLLFERFLSADKFTTPDIDVDFAADRREEVIRYVYNRYGRANTAMVCNVVTYRARSALRDLGKVLDFPEAVIERLIGRLEADSPTAAAEAVEALVAESEAAPALTGAPASDALAQSAAATQAGAPMEHPLRHLADLLRQIDGCPRHLSIHSGGMLITGPPLNEVVPLEPATMPGRVVVQWDKDSCEDAGLIKIDLLGLGMLGMLSVAMGYLPAMGLPEPDLNAIPLDDPAIFHLLQRADTIGTFQVESRAQQQMLPRLKPTRFEDIIIEVAIVRPGPIQGGAVHPYLRRRAGLEPVSYLHPSLEPVLAETLGVLLFQEQAIRVSVASAGFAPGEADMLRRAMSRARSAEAMGGMRDRFVQGAAAQGIDLPTADAIFVQLAGFAGYGFCKSHAASFALIAYQSLWLKKYYPAPFYCALFNQQPMGFYPIEVVAGDARRHGVEILPPDVNRSVWLYTIEEDPRPGKGRWAIRTGMMAVTGLGEAGWQRMEAARAVSPHADAVGADAVGADAARTNVFTDLADFCIRTQLDRDVCVALIRAGACDALSDPPGERRQLLWRLGEIDARPTELPLPQSAPVTEQPALPALDPLEKTAWEYELLGLSPAGQIMRHYREALRARKIAGGWEVKQMEQGDVARVAGMMAVRQRPGTAKGIVFISLEDESGLLDLVVKPDAWMRLRDVLRGSMLLLVEGTVQRSGRAVSLLVHSAWPLVESIERQPSRKAQRAFFY